MSENIFNEKHFTFTWQNLFSKTEVKIDLPDLNNLKSTSSGDWGPNYTFELNPSELIKIQYHDLKTDVIDNYTMENNTLYIESPMLAETRKVYPYFYKIEDQNKNIQFVLYVNNQFELKKVEIKRLIDEVEIFSEEVA